MPETINSSLLFKREDGKPEFVHDSFKDYLAAFYVVNALNKEGLDASLPPVFSRIIQLVNFNVNTYSEMIAKNLGIQPVGGRNVRTLATNVSEILNTYFNNENILRIMNDEFINEKFNITNYCSAGPNSSLIVHVNKKSLFNIDTENLMIDLTNHMHEKYKIQLILLDASSGELAPEHFRQGEREEYTLRNRDMFQNGSLTGIEMCLIENPSLKGYGVEDKELYLKLREQHRIKESLRIPIFDSEPSMEEKLKCIGLVQSNPKFDTDLFLRTNNDRANALINNACKIVNESKERIALLSYFHIGEIGELNQYQFISRGVSYIAIEPKSEPSFDRKQYRDRMGFE